MKPVANKALTTLLGGAMLLGAATPTMARHWHPWAAAGAGFIAGTAVGAAAARGYYGPHYYYGPTYAPATTYVEVEYPAPAYNVYDAWGNCWVEESYGRRTPCSGY
jgi:hypothetical protein